MGQADTLTPVKRAISTGTKPCKATAAGLFGYSIREGKAQSLAPIIGYIRELEQMPNFAPPSADQFAELYVRSNIGITRSAS